MALILFSSIEAPILNMSSSDVYEGERTGEKAWGYLTGIAGAESLGTIDAQRGRGFTLGFNVELSPFTPHLPGVNMAKGGEHEYYDEWMRKTIEPPEPKPLSPSPGDWVVSGTEVRENQVIVLTGNLIVESGGNLTLINCTLYMDCAYDGEWQIRVESRGIMNVLEGSVITAHNPDYEFLFYVYGCLVMRDSELHECGYDWNHPGLCIETDKGVIIEGCRISQNMDGIHCYDSSDITISNCEISQNDCGICCYDSSGITIRGCKINQNGRGIFCSFSSDITIMDCRISQNNLIGIGCWSSLSITITGCTFTHDSVSFSGYKLSHFASHVVENNTVNGKPLYYIVNVMGPYNVPSDAGQVIIVNSRHVKLTNADLSHTDVGLEVVYSSDITIMDCKIGRNDWHYCSCFFHSSDIIIRGCEISQNGGDGVICEGSSDITIMDCRISQNFDGIVCGRSSGITIMDCRVNGNCWNGIVCGDSLNITIIDCSISGNWDEGIVCRGSSGMTIMDCRINGNHRRGIHCQDSSDITISGCEISRNGHGIYCRNSSYVAIHYCDIYANARHGLYANCDYVVNATYNWWGSPDGPEYKEEGDPLDPEEVYSTFGLRYLIYEPWLTKPVKTELTLLVYINREIIRILGSIPLVRDMIVFLERLIPGYGALTFTMACLVVIVTLVILWRRRGKKRTPSWTIELSRQSG